MTCKYCNREVKLNPSASERAKKFGGTAQDYKNMFPNHTSCMVKARNQDTLNLINARKNNAFK